MHICDLCGKKIKRDDLLTVKNMINWETIGRLHLECFDDILKFRREAYVLFRLFLETEWNWYKEIVLHIRESKAYEKANRTGDKR